MYGLANYAVNALVRKKRESTLNQLIFSPPIGTTLFHREAIKLPSLIKRIVNVNSLEMRDALRLRLPTISLPLVISCLLDVPAVYMLHEIMPSILLVSYDMQRGYPTNPRGYEEYNLADVLEFCKRLSEAFWNFRTMVKNLLSLARDYRYQSQIFNMLVNLALGIKNKDLTYFNDVVAKIQSLPKEVKFKIHFLTDKDILSIQRALKF